MGQTRLTHRYVESDPICRKVLEANGATPQSSTPEEFAAFIKSELDKWERVVKEAGVSL